MCAMGGTRTSAKRTLRLAAAIVQIKPQVENCPCGAYAERMKRWPIVAVSLFVCGTLIPTAAQACRTGWGERSLLHASIPALPAGTVAAEVEVITSVGRGKPFEARILRMIGDEYNGSRLSLGVVSLCDSLPEPGDRGFIVGRVISRSADKLILAPISTR